MIGLDTFPVPAEDVVGRIIQNQPDDSLEAVLVLPSRGRINVLNEIGAHIWSLVDGTRTVMEIAEVICLDYDVDLVTAQNDTTEFLRELLERGAIKLSKKPVG